MSPTSAIILYLSLFIVIFVIIIIFLIFRQNKIISGLYNYISKIDKDLQQLKEADKAVIRKVISDDAVSRIFPYHYHPDIKAAKIARRKEILYDADQKITQNLERAGNVIGLKVLDKLGVLMILLALIFLVGLGIEYNWINSIGQVFFGIIIGGVLLIFGYLFKAKFPKLASVLFGGGFSSLIFTTFSAYYQYDLIPLWAAYLLVVVVIGISVIIAVVSGDNEVAILTFAAGFIAPLTVNFAREDYKLLFIYVLLLDLGVLAFDYFRKSLFINLLTFIFTFLIYGIWLIEKILKPNPDIPFGGSMLFLTLFYILIFIAIIINNIKEGRKFIGLEFSLLISATATYYTAGYIIIDKLGLDYKGIFTLWIAVINYAFFLILYPKRNFDRRILNLFLALSMMFFGLVVPVQLMGKSPTLVWALQAVLLMFISIKADLNGMKLGSLELTVLMLGSLFFDLYDQYVGTVANVEIADSSYLRTFISTTLAVFSLFANAYLLKFEKKDYFGVKFLPKKVYQGILVGLGFLTFYITVRLAIIYSAIQIYDDQAVIKLFLSLFNYSLLLIPALIALFVDKKPVNLAAIGSFVLAYALYLVTYAGSWSDLRDQYLLTGDVSKLIYDLHYIAALMLAIISLAGLKALTKILHEHNTISYLSTFVFVGLVLFFISNELANWIIVKTYQPHLLIQAMLQKIHRLHYTIVWGITALLLLILGISLKDKELKVSGILLYLISLVKIGVYDYFKLNNEELIILFIVMGSVMLLGALVFQWHYNSLVKESKNGTTA